MVTRNSSAVPVPAVSPRTVLRLLRPHQWIKNGFVLVGVVFGHQWALPLAGQVALVFAAFCAAASAVYVLNDLRDAPADRQHPVKCRRPIASGAVSPALAQWLSGGLAALALLLAALATPAALAIVLGYMLMNVAYTLRLKRVVVVDVFIIAAGFMLRILAGTIGVGIPPSSWLLLCGLMVTLFLGFAKRRAEMMGAEQPGAPAKSRSVLDAYSPAMLDQFQSITATCTVLSYALYTVSPETVALHGTDKLIYTVPFIVYGIFRYLFLLHRAGSGQDTARDLVRDKHLVATALGFAATTLWLLK